MQQTAARSIWSKMRSTLWLGIPLGLLQTAVTWFSLTWLVPITVSGFALPSDWIWLAFVLGALLSLLLPAIAGFHAAQQGAEALESASVGRRVGCISFIMVAISPILLIILLATDTLLSQLHIVLSFKSLFFNGAGLIELVFFMVLPNVLGVLVAYLGGLLGGELGQRWREDSTSNLHAHRNSGTRR